MDISQNGIVSSLGVVESTARCAFDMGYSVTVLEDCCSDRDTEGEITAGHGR